ncbi:glycoside hydrolase [Thozetella sp. PMI_491]|nr:glycoside hydrolase [Thozetella sp. PMI_491]
MLSSWPYIALLGLALGRAALGQELNASVAAISPFNPNCGFDPVKHCGDTCVSKCDAKPECGEFADPPGLECPIHVCCSEYGFCGTEPKFCTGKCQSNCEQPGKTSPYTTDVREMVIGYVEGWAFTRRGCGKRTMDDIKIDSITHLYASFGYIKPSTFEVYPMPGVSERDMLNMTDLKRRAPGLKVFIALGGWSYSDNDTDTQAVWADLSSTQAKREKFLGELEKFMVHYGFDGVDYDWEYPGAPDRGGHKQDGENYVALVEATRNRFKTVGRGWGISFTAPSSYWYLRHFNIEDMMPHVDWVNLMTYDLYGSWDKESNWIGPHVYGHTNLTVIKQALDLLWRNNVPANQVNLGLGFYGRTYKLSDPSCDRPGCDFDDPGTAGQCSGQAGYMSYQDIAWKRESSGAPVVTDKENTIKYFRYNDDQWVSFDDEETIRWKVDFANSQGLRGLFIWAITQDTTNHTMLNAVLQPEGLGKFKEKNRVHSDIDDWDGKSPDKCVFSDCDGSCDPGMIPITDIRCDPVGNKQPRKLLCCPIGNAYDSKYCKWRADKNTVFCGIPFVSHYITKCVSGEDTVASDTWFKDDQGRDDVCHFYTEADYCCAQEREDTCKWSGVCTGQDDVISCPDGMEPLDGGSNLAIREGKCDIFDNKWDVLCCEKEVKPQCRWVADENNNCAAECDSDEVNWGRHFYGGGKQCEDPRYPSNQFYQYGYPSQGQSGRLLCCKRDSVRADVKKLPVPLEYLFDETIETDEDQEFDIDVDVEHDHQDQHPNANSFGWHIMSGPPDQLSNINKRDGSHWEVYGCDPARHEGVQSARLVCTRDKNHNCDDIRMGGVADTILEMPTNCGPGKYAMAISLEPMHEASFDKTMPRLVKRDLPPNAVVYNLTFDYGFHRLQGRADNNVKLRIDYSNAKDYWNQVVDIEHEVNRDHGGDWKSYLDHSYRMERRDTPEEERHILEQRWYTAKLVDWIARLGSVQKEVDVLDKKIEKTFIYKILDEKRSCMISENVQATVEADLHAKVHAEIQTSGVLTIIGNMNDMTSFKHSYVNFRNKGGITASLIFHAYGELRIPYKEQTLLGFAPIGASFKVPGVVTIGPEMKLVASVEGKVSVEA